MVLKLALDSDMDWLPPFMELAYLCRARKGEVLAYRRDVLSPWLLHNGRGEPVGKRTVESGWKRIMAKAVEQGAELPADLAREAEERGGVVVDGKVKLREKFPIHDIKAKGLSDATHHSAGHRSARMFDVYMRKLQEIAPSSNLENPLNVLK